MQRLENAHPATRAARRGQRGFTILELVTTVFVMAILAAVAMPEASSDTDRRLNMLQLQIQDALEHAQSIAYHTGAKSAVKFGTAGNGEEPWLAVINELGVPLLDPLTKTYYIVRFDQGGQPVNVFIDAAHFGGAGRPIAGFNDKGVLIYPGTIQISADGEQRLFSVNTATARLEEIPIGS